MGSTARAVPYAAPDHGICDECGGSYPLRQIDGLIRRHNDCAGGGKPPAKVKTTEDVPLPEVEKVRHE